MQSGEEWQRCTHSSRCVTSDDTHTHRLTEREREVLVLRGRWQVMTSVYCNFTVCCLLCVLYYVSYRYSKVVMCNVHITTLLYRYCCDRIRSTTVQYTQTGKRLDAAVFFYLDSVTVTIYRVDFGLDQCIKKHIWESEEYTRKK
jgi:hypothetical protein